MPAVCGPTAALQRVEVDVAVRQRRDLLHRAAAHRRGGRIGAVRRVGHDDLGAGEVAARAVIGADHRHAGELALRTGHRRQRHAAHAGHFLQHLLQLVQAVQEALPRRLRRQRMPAEEPGQHRVLVTGPRVVLHRARAERVEVRVDGEVELRQPREVAHRLQLGDFRQQRACCCRRSVSGHVGATAAASGYCAVGAAAGTRVLEDQWFAHGMFLGSRLRPRRRSASRPRARGIRVRCPRACASRWRRRAARLPSSG